MFLLLFGLGDLAKIAVAAFAAWLVIVFNVAYGVMNARQTRILAAQIDGRVVAAHLPDVIFFETLPQTFVGLRTAVSLALVVIIVAEMFIGATDGMGHRIIDAQISYSLTDMYGSILVAGAMGYGLNLVLLLHRTLGRPLVRANSRPYCNRLQRSTCDVKIDSRSPPLSRPLLPRGSGANAACDKMDKVTAVWLPIMQTTAYYVALEEKLFEKACIEIVSNKMESPNQIIDALIAERADFGPPGRGRRHRHDRGIEVSRKAQGVRAAGRRHRGQPDQ